MGRNDDKDRVRQAFAARFRKALAELGYSASEQKAMGQLFGLSGQAVRKWAEGEALPTSSRLPQVATVLGVRRAWLQDGEEPMRPVAYRISDHAGGYGSTRQQEITLSGKEVNLLQQYRILSPQQRHAVENIIALFSKATRK